MASRFDSITYEQAIRMLQAARSQSAREQLNITGAHTPTFSNDFVGPLAPGAARAVDQLNNNLNLLISRTSAIKYFRGEHWQGGFGWMGPRPPRDNEKHGSVMSEIFNGFTPQGAITDIVGRHRDGVIGTEPYWSIVPNRPMGTVEKTFKAGETGPDGQVLTQDLTLMVEDTPNEDEQARIDMATARITEWWDDHDVLTYFQNAVVAMLCEERGYVRLFLPDLEELFDPKTGIGVIEEGPLEEMLERIFVNSPDPDQAAVYIDPLTMKPVGIYSYSINDILSNKTLIFAEVCYIDENGDTIIKRLSPGTSTQVSVPYTPASGTVTSLFSGEKETGETHGPDPLQLSGRLTIFELKRERFVTEPIKRHQALLDMSETMMGRNVVQGGFLERIILNAQMPGKWVDDPDNAGKKKFVPNPVFWGSGTTNVFQGVSWTETQGEQKKVHLATPSVVYRDPVAVTTFTETSEHCYKNIYREAHQVHILMTGDARMAADSRKQARDDYEKSLKKSKTVIEAAGRKIIETVLSWAAQLAGKANMFNDLRVNFECRLDTGPLDAMDREAIIKEYEAELRDDESAMSMLGIDDTTAMIQKIAEMKARRAAQGPPAPDPNNPGNPNNPNDTNNPPPEQGGGTGSGAGAGAGA